MSKKTTIIIMISVAVIGLFAYLIFSSGKSSDQGGESLPSFRSSEGKKSAKRSKKTDTQNAQSLNSPSSQSENAQDAQSQSFQSQQRPAQQGYFNITPILSSSQLNRQQPRSNSQLSTTFQASDFRPATTSGVGAGGGGDSSSSGEGFSSSNPRMEPCIATLQPILDAKSTDTSAITSALLDVAGFSMLPVPTQNTYIQSVVTQSKGASASAYCKVILQSTNPQSINAAGLYNDCQSMVQNFSNTKTSGASEYDAITAFESLGILNGATTSAQKKSTLQKYFGAEYEAIITAMKGLNANNIEMQKRVICAKVSSGIINGVNGSSAFLSCVTSINAAKKSNLTDVSAAIPVYSRLIGSDQTLIAKGYKEFLAGTKTAEELCTFIIKNTTISTKEADVLSSMVLNSSEGIYKVCDSIVNATKSTYNDYLMNSDVDEIGQIIRVLDPYEFIIPDTYRSNVVKHYITSKISNSTFRALSSQNQAMIGSRLYATYYSLSSFSNPSITGVYQELFPQLCKCSHIGFDDMAWKNAVVAYMISKRGGATSLSGNTITKESTIASSDFRKTCYQDITNQFNKSTITLATATPQAMATIIKAIAPQYKALNDIEVIVAPLSCYADKCMGGSTCPQSCIQTVELACDKLAEKYITTVPPKSDTTSIFNCPQSAEGKAYDSNVCYALTSSQRESMTNDFYETIQKFQEDASDVRKEIIENLWKIHANKQKETNTSVSSNQCMEEANKAWLQKLQE